ncbi:MAG: DUF3006 domain-containing protein [Oscillospiraceae bacterium]
MYYSVDRIEGNIAALIGEDGSSLMAAVEELPYGTHEGDMLLLEGGSFAAAPEKTQQRRAEIQSLLDQLLQNNGE